jgi:hypothetical protein
MHFNASFGLLWGVDGGIWVYKLAGGAAMCRVVAGENKNKKKDTLGPNDMSKCIVWAFLGLLLCHCVDFKVVMKNKTN